MFSCLVTHDYFRFLASLLFVDLLNLLFDDANGLVQPVGILAHPLDLDSRKPFAGVLRRLAQWLEMPGPQLGSKFVMPQ
jgi:hypothetical protein